VNKAVDDGVARTRGRVVSVTFYDNVFTGLNFSFATRAAGEEVEEESLSVFSNGGVVTPLENFLWKCSMGYNLYPWISLLEFTLETSYKPQT